VAEKKKGWKRWLPGKLGQSTPVVPVISLAGAIGRGGKFSQTLSLASTVGQIEKAFKIKEATAIALIINSPGGSPAQSNLIMRRIRQLAEEKELPVYAFVEDVAASGGYMLALAADEIFVDPSSIIGSIGVISAGFGYNELIERYGVERRVYTAGTNKLKLDPFSPEKKDDIRWLKSLQQDIHDYFISMVRERRGKRLVEDDNDLMNGDVWVGQKAVEFGLVDGVSDIRSTLREKFGEEVKMKFISPPSKSPLKFLGLEFSGLEVFQGKLVNTVVETVEEKAAFSRFGL
jgi:signal peptide peptidase SppA